MLFRIVTVEFKSHSTAIAALPNAPSTVLYKSEAYELPILSATTLIALPPIELFTAVNELPPLKFIPVPVFPTTLESCISIMHPFASMPVAGPPAATEASSVIQNTPPPAHRIPRPSPSPVVIFTSDRYKVEPPDIFTENLGSPFWCGSIPRMLRP